MSCAPVTNPVSNRRSGPCSPSTHCCAGPWSPPWKPAPAPTPIGPASPPPCKAARDQLTAAHGIHPDNPVDLLGTIGRAVLATLLPARRPRYRARKVNTATSRYLNRDDGRPTHPTTITAINIAIHTPPLTPRPRPRRNPTIARTPQPTTRRHHPIAIMNADPGRTWTGRELAEHLHVKPRNLLTQLAEWTHLGFLTRTSKGNHALNTPP